MNPQHTVCVIC